YVGDIVEIEARVVHTTERSIYLVVRAWSGKAEQRDLQPVDQSIAIMVVAGDGKAEPVPSWQPQTDAERQLQRLAIDLESMRNKNVSEWSTVEIPVPGWNPFAPTFGPFCAPLLWPAVCRDPAAGPKRWRDPLFACPQRQNY